MVVCVCQWSVSNPSLSLSKSRKPRKCSLYPMKRQKEPALQMGKESTPNLPALAAEPHEEINQSCLREWEGAGMLPKGSQCSPQTSNQSQHLWGSRGKVAILPSRVWGQIQGLVSLTSPALPLGPDPRS